MRVLSFAAAAIALAQPNAAPTPLPGYTLVEDLSDEFSAASLNITKWGTSAKDISWPGRQPGLFDPANVIVGGGHLQLWARAARRNCESIAAACGGAHARAPRLNPSPSCSLLAARL